MGNCCSSCRKKRASSPSTIGYDISRPTLIAHSSHIVPTAVPPNTLASADTNDPSNAEAALNAAFASYVSRANGRPAFQNISNSLTIAEPSGQYLNGGYWASWKQPDGYLPSSVPLASVTHIHYAFADVDVDGTVYLKDEHTHFEAEIDGTNGGLRAWTQRKSTYPALKITLTVGGGDPEIANTFAAVAQDPERRTTFVESLRFLVMDFGLDGVDIDWLSPKDAVEANNYLRLLAELRRALGRDSWISILLPADMVLLEHFKLAEMAGIVTFINLATFDFVIPMVDPVIPTGHHAQLFANGEDGNNGNPCGAAIVRYVADRGVPPSKIMLGIPLYGRVFGRASVMGQNYAGPGSGEDATYAVKDLPPRCGIELFDRWAVAAYSTGSGEFISYDNQDSVARKTRFVKRLGLRGLFYYHLAQDRYGDGSLVKRGHEALSSPELEGGWI